MFACLLVKVASIELLLTGSYSITVDSRSLGEMLVAILFNKYCNSAPDDFLELIAIFY